MSRKELTESRNIGAAYGEQDRYFDGPILAEARASGVMVERVLYGILKTEFDRLVATEGAADLERIFGHIFDPMAGAEERAEYVMHLQRRPPTITLGYPRVTTEPPVVAIVLGEEEEDDTTAGLSDYVGETLEGESGPYAEYVGVHFRQSYMIYCFSDHPVVTAYLYHAVKLILLAAKQFMISAGVVSPTLSGGELAPDEAWTPEDWFSRVVRLSCHSLSSVPVLKLDPSRFQLGGLFMDDIVVDGVRGGVHPTGTTAEDDPEE